MSGITLQSNKSNFLATAKGKDKLSNLIG